MAKIPLKIRLKREAHRKIAYAQDLIVEELYNIFPKAVLHGGTAIWRCYSGKRFSEDLDFYIQRDEKGINELFKLLEGKGFKVIKKKVSENSIYSELLLERTPVRLEATFQKVHGILCNYELSDGNMIAIYSLSLGDFIIEKISAYLKRFKIRDLWDIFFLLNSLHDFARINKYLSMLISNYKDPIDESDLKSIILEGVVPSSKEMVDYIKRKWEK